MLEKLFLSMIIASSLFLNGCLVKDDSRQIEKKIRSEVIKAGQSVGSLQAIYMLTFIHFEDHWLLSPDLYIQKDKVEINYGFPIEMDSIRVINKDGRKVLQVKLGNAEELAVNRISVGKPETTHEGYRPKDAKTGELIKIDEHMQAEIEKLKQIYGEHNLKHARENIKNFFRIIAAKYDLVLEFE